MSRINTETKNSLIIRCRVFVRDSYTGFRGEGWSDNPKGWLDAPRTMGCKLGEELEALVKGKN